MLDDHHERGQSELRASEQYITSDTQSSPESFLRHLFEKWRKNLRKTLSICSIKLSILDVIQEQQEDEIKKIKEDKTFQLFSSKLRCLFETSVYIQSKRKLPTSSDRLVETGGIKPDQGEFFKTDLICEIFQILVTAKRVQEIYRKIW